MRFLLVCVFLGAGSLSGAHRLTVTRIIAIVIAAAATVDDDAEQGGAIKCIQGALDNFLFADTFANYHQNSVGELHPEGRIRHRYDRWSVNDDPVKEFAEPVE